MHYLELYRRTWHIFSFREPACNDLGESFPQTAQRPTWQKLPYTAMLQLMLNNLSFQMNTWPNPKVNRAPLDAPSEQHSATPYVPSTFKSTLYCQWHLLCGSPSRCLPLLAAITPAVRAPADWVWPDSLICLPAAALPLKVPPQFRALKRGRAAGCRHCVASSPVGGSAQFKPKLWR